jgi:hypothetical protein
MNTELKVFDFVGRFTRCRSEQLSLATTILGDLGVDGDAANELIQAFSQEFHVDMSSFPFDQYFGTEGWPIWAPLYWACRIFFAPFYWKQTTEECAGLKLLRIADLVLAADKQSWHAV